MAARIFTHLLCKECINLMEFLAVKISLPVPSWTRNTLGAEDEWKIVLGPGKQASHAIAAHSFQGPGSRFRVLECLTTHIFINPLHWVVASDERFSLIPWSASAVFFSSPVARSSYGSGSHNALGSNRPID